VELSDKAVSSVLLSLSDGGALRATLLEKHDEPEKDDSANGKLRIIHVCPIFLPIFAQNFQ